MFVSIIIGYRNRDLSRIKLSLDFINQQTNKNLEVIFVDYGSDEIISNEVKVLAEEYPFVSYNFNNTQGWFWNRSHALNTGIHLAKGEIILFFDIDIIIEPDFIEKISKLEYKNSFYLFECFYLPSDFDFFKKNVLIEGTYYRQDYVGLCAVKKENITAINGFDEYFMVWGAEDEDLYTRLENSGLEMKRLTASDYRVFHQWHPVESPTFPTIWYLTMINRLFNKNRLSTGIDQVYGLMISQKERQIFSLIQDDCFDVELKLLTANKFLIFHDFIGDFLNPSYLSGKFRFIKTAPKKTDRKKKFLGLNKKEDLIEYTNTREITQFIQYIVGINRGILEDYFFSSTDDEINFYYLKNLNPTVANG